MNDRKVIVLHNYLWPSPVKYHERELFPFQKRVGLGVIAQEPPPERVYLSLFWEVLKVES